MLGFFVFMISINAYDNGSIHQTFNGAVVETFEYRMKEQKVGTKFENYEFNFDYVLNGNYISQADNRQRIEAEKDMKVRDWISHGGYSADEPEGWQALRHFYDPNLATTSLAYLSDINDLQLCATYLGSSLGTVNPQIDAVEWALEDKGEIIRGTDQLTQLYSWNDGKKFLIDALYTLDEKEREKLMAKAWRAFGETMHLFFDMACPSHVRNDGHPPYFGSFDQNVVNFWGDPDIYETKVIGTSYLVGGYPDATIENKIKNLTTVRAMMHELAMFTNQNFFTNQTISGLANGAIVKPIVRPDYPYSLPKLEENGNGWRYDQEKFSYYKSINGKEVLMCKDQHSSYWGLGSNYRAKPFMDNECCNSIGNVLVPTAKRSAQYLFDKYIPHFVIEIENSTNPTEVKGKIKHKQDLEYTSELLYQGKVVIFNKDKNKKFETTANSGNFVLNDATLSDGTYIAYIEFGGIKVNSNEFTKKTTGKVPFVVDAQIDGVVGTGNPLTARINGYFSKPGAKIIKAEALYRDYTLPGTTDIKVYIEYTGSRTGLIDTFWVEYTAPPNKATDFIALTGSEYAYSKWQWEKFKKFDYTNNVWIENKEAMSYGYNRADDPEITVSGPSQCFPNGTIRFDITAQFFNSKKETKSSKAVSSLINICFVTTN